MEDYYRLLGIHYESTIDDINTAYQNKIIEFKSLPYMTDNDKTTLKNIKKAFAIFNNHEFKKIYDQYYLNKFQKELNSFDDMRNNKKNVNHNYLVDRIFNFNNNNNYNLKYNELLRPKNVGLSSDKDNEFDSDNKKSDSDFLPFNFDS